MNSTRLTPEQWIEHLEKKSQAPTSSSKKTTTYFGSFNKKENLSKDTLDKMSIKQICEISQNFIKNLPETDEKKKITENTLKLIDLKSQEIKDTVKKTNSTWLTALKWVSLATLIFWPTAVLIHVIQSWKTNQAEKELNELSLLKNSIDTQKWTKETSKMISSSFIPLVNQSTGVPTDPASIFKSFLRREHIDVHSERLDNIESAKKSEADDLDIFVPHEIRADLPRFSLLRFNGETLYSNLDNDHNNAKKSYSQLLDIFGEKADTFPILAEKTVTPRSKNAPVTNAVLLTLTQGIMADVNVARFFSDEKLGMTSSNMNTRCFDILLKDGMLTISIKAIDYEQVSDIDDSPDHNFAAYIVSRKYEMPLQELKDALENNNPDLLIHLKAEDKISSLNLLTRKKGEKPSDTPTILNSREQSFELSKKATFELLKAVE